MAQLTLTGALMKQAGLELVADSNASFVETMRTIAKGISILRGQVCSDDLREAASKARLKPKSPNVWGCIFRGPEWVEVGRKISEHPSNHAREIRVWKWEQP